MYIHMLNRGPAERSMTANILLAMTNWEEKHSYVWHDTLQRAPWPTSYIYTQIYVYIPIYIYIYIYTYVYIYVPAEQWVSVKSVRATCVPSYTYFCSYTYMYIYWLNRGPPGSGMTAHISRSLSRACALSLSLYIYIYIYILIYVHIYIHIHIYTRTHWFNRGPPGSGMTAHMSLAASWCKEKNVTGAVTVHRQCGLTPGTRIAVLDDMGWL